MNKDNQEKLAPNVLLIYKQSSSAEIIEIRVEGELYIFQFKTPQDSLQILDIGFNFWQSPEPDLNFHHSAYKLLDEAITGFVTGSIQNKKGEAA